MSDLTWRNETRKLSELVPWEHNPKRMTKKQADGLRASIEHFGFAVPFLVSPDGDIYDGHQRQTLMSAIKDYGPNATVDVRVSSRPLTDDERRELVIRLKQNQAGWDFDMLGNLYEREELLEWGFEDAELGMFPDDDKPDDPGPQIDKAEELREKWQTEVGQLWAIGEHRLIVGDCRDAQTWARLLEGVKVNGVFTSPPYAEQRKEQYGGVPTAEYVEWWEAVQANVKAHLAGDGSFFVNIKPHCEEGERVLYVFDLVLAMRRRWGWRFVDEWCWRLTTNGMPGNFSPRLKNAFEPVFWFAFGDPKLRTGEIMQKTKPASVKRYSNLSDKEASGARISSTTGSGFNKDFTAFSLSEALPSNVLELAPAVNDNSHAAAFPVSLPDFFVRAYSDTGDLWLDPFCGSGTTIVAAHNNNRRGYGIELLPKYAAVILERLQDLGLEPVLTGGNT